MERNYSIKESVLNALICIVVLGSLMTGPIVFTYLEYRNYWPLSVVLPTAGIAHILINLFMMPLSWLILFLSVPLLLPDRQFSFSAKKYRIAMITLSVACLLAAPINLIVFTQLALGNAVSQATSTISVYMNDTKIQNAWDQINSRNTCCGVNGPQDWIAVGFIIAPCAGRAMGCFQSITSSFFIMWTMSFLAQVFGTVIASAKFVQKMSIFKRYFRRLYRYLHRIKSMAKNDVIK